MQTEKNKWIEDVLTSADSIQRTSSPDMAGQVLSRAATKPAAPIVWRIAASVALLITLNVGTLLFHSLSHPDGTPSHQPSMLIDLGVSDQEDVGTLFFGR